MPSLQFAGWRFLFSGLILLPWVSKASGYTGKAITKIARQHIRLLVLLGLLQIGLKYACFYIGLSFIPAALGAMLSGAGPLIVALVAHLSNRQEKLNGPMWGALLIGLLGVIVLTLGRQQMGPVNNLSLVGIALLLLNNVVAAIGDIAVSKEKQGIPPMLLASTSLIFGGAGLLAVGIPIEGFATFPPHWEFYGSLAALCFISSVGFSIWFSLLKKPFVRVSTLNFWKFLIPLLGAVIAWIIMPDEQPTWVAALGMGLIIMALLLLNRSKPKA